MSLVIATGVDGVYDGWGTDRSRRLDRILVEDLDPAALEAGSMRPKVEAAASFTPTGGRAVIGALADLPELVSGRAGTAVLATGASAR